ncbi:hypothetical protein CDAR_85371 [Caerostris darwini]|uniref:Uncharacterized protein n=1 Tax=Caerostris darwini TaxID=1538125 RepID=A0AAV4UHV4_9ARAC|nr:hypothetical protein CDAR_85371 [Caerostris darwini]
MSCAVIWMQFPASRAASGIILGPTEMADEHSNQSSILKPISATYADSDACRARMELVGVLCVEWVRTVFLLQEMIFTANGWPGANEEEDITNTEEEDITNTEEEDITNTEEEDITNTEEEDITNTEEEDITNTEEEDITSTEFFINYMMYYNNHN